MADDHFGDLCHSALDMMGGFSSTFGTVEQPMVVRVSGYPSLLQPWLGTLRCHQRSHWRISEANGGIFVGKLSRHMDNQHLRQLSRASETWPLRSCTSPPARPNGEHEPGVQKPHQLRNGRTATQSTQTGSLGAKEKIISFRNSPNNQWIGLREILQESWSFLMGKSMVSCRFSLKPIH